MLQENVVGGRVPQRTSALQRNSDTDLKSEAGERLKDYTAMIE